MFQLKYGSYQHQPGECKVDINRQGNVSALGTIASVNESWRITGRLQGTDSNNVNALVAALQTAYSIQSLDVSLIGTNLGIQSKNTLGGIRVVKPPFFPDGGNAEGGTFRSYEIALEAEVIVGGAEAQLLEWQQTLTSTGGGPRFVFLPNIIGPPTKQTTQQQTPYQVTQAGHAVGLLGTPQPALPIWPLYEHVDQRTNSAESPTPYGVGVGQKMIRYGVNWSYFFESAFPISGGGSVPSFFIPVV